MQSDRHVLFDAGIGWSNATAVLPQEHEDEGDDCQHRLGADAAV